MKKKYNITGKETYKFNNNVDYCVGTGRMGLALQKEYMDQLKLVQEQIGFKYIRGHGLFTDDMAIYQEYKDSNGETRVEYNFTYLDMVMDGYMEVGIRPFLELGFMPKKLASGEQTVFYWKSNVTPPKSYPMWTDMICAVLKHLMERYGEKEVLSWPIEIWNEPNLQGFWKDADMPEYFKLFKETFLAIKALNPAFRVGGPAICGGSDGIWIKAFVEFCLKENIKPDYITRHHYTIDQPDRDGHYTYAVVREPKQSMDEVEVTREIVDSFEEYNGIDIHITEFNTSYSPDTPLHDTNLNAAYIANMLSVLGNEHASYSYWTFGDIFEELGVPFTPFYGGFGMVANGCIPKPTFWTFRFFKQLMGTCIHKADDLLLVQTADGIYKGCAWNIGPLHEDKELELELRLNTPDGEYTLIKHIVDEDSCNPLKLWHDMGEPSSLCKNQKELLKLGAQPLVQSDIVNSQSNRAEFTLCLKKNAVVYFELGKRIATTDRGYDYNRAIDIKINK